MTNTKIKICGLKREEDIDFANTLNPDFIGYIFAPKSKRYVSPETALTLRRKLSDNIISVGVFVNESIDKIAELLDSNIIGMAQLHGQENEDYIASLRLLTDKPIIKAYKIECEEDIKKAAQSSADYILLDNGDGGTGKSFDWSLIKNVKRPFFLAGGLNADNVKTGIKLIHPYAVDTSSGVETNNIKDFGKMKRFINTVRGN